MERGSSESQTTRVGLQALFESLTRAETHGLGSLDLNRLSGLRIAAHARRALAHAERAETDDLHRSASLYASPNGTQHCVQRPLGRRFAELFPQLFWHNINQLRFVHVFSLHEILWLPFESLIPTPVRLVFLCHNRPAPSIKFMLAAKPTTGDPTFQTARARHPVRKSILPLHRSRDRPRQRSRHRDHEQPRQ